jgi:hypothetical protein
MKRIRTFSSWLFFAFSASFYLPGTTSYRIDRSCDKYDLEKAVEEALKIAAYAAYRLPTVRARDDSDGDDSDESDFDEEEDDRAVNAMLENLIGRDRRRLFLRGY